MATQATTAARTTPLSADEIIEYYERGFIRPGRILTNDQVERVCEALDRAREREAAAGREFDLLDPALWPAGEKPPPEPGKTVGFLFNLWLQDGSFREVCFNPTLAQWSAQLIGARQVRLLEDGAIYKEPGGKGGTLKWHQDYPYWPLSAPAAATAWIALDKVTLENGAMKIALGSHLTGERLPGAFGTGETYLEDKRPPTVRPIEDPEALGIELAIDELEAGEVSLHHPLTWHASGPNTTDRPRRAFVIRYAGDGAIWLGSRRYEYNYADDEVGIAIGEPLGGRYFPLVPF
jgi:Phytanoyl-CoA dioxygenase (PhyH)